MADISKELQAIMNARYGRDVRDSIRNAIYKVNESAEEAIEIAEIKFGTDVTSPTSPVGSYIEKTVYINTDTGIIWQLIDGKWV